MKFVVWWSKFFGCYSCTVSDTANLVFFFYVSSGVYILTFFRKIGKFLKKLKKIGKTMSFLKQNTEKAQKSIYIEVDAKFQPMFKFLPKNETFNYFINFGKIKSFNVKHSYGIIEFEDVSSVDNIMQNPMGHVIKKIALTVKSRDVKPRSTLRGISR